jgi:hypothetical protein
VERKGEGRVRRTERTEQRNRIWLHGDPMAEEQYEEGR